MACFSPFLYAPLYVFIIFAFIFEKEWIRIPGNEVDVLILTVEVLIIQH
jgi:hypothetical protein